MHKSSESHYAMFFKSQQFGQRLAQSPGWSDHVFQFCDFAGIGTEGGEVDSMFAGCKVEHCEWYWGLFNQAVFVQVEFKGCTFRGTHFAGCKFVECSFSDCRFSGDNLGADCAFDEVAWYGCTQTGCSGLEGQFANAPAVS